MAKSPVIYVNDILAAIRRIERYTKGMSREAFGLDERTQDAVTRCLEIVSEASRRIPGAMKAKHPSVPWSRIAGIGNILRHEYRAVSTDVIWEVVQSHLGDVKRATMALKKELAQASRDAPRSKG
jgi:uncharacterized protein with HEPN domain